MVLPRFLFLIALLMGTGSTSSPDAASDTSLAVQDILPPFVLKQRMSSSLTGDPKGGRTDL